MGRYFRPGYEAYKSQSRDGVVPALSAESLKIIVINNINHISIGT